MSPENDRGGDAFDDFFGDPSPSGRMGPVPAESDTPAPTEDLSDPEDEPTQDVDLRGVSQEPAPHGAVPEDWWQPDPAEQPGSARPESGRTGSARTGSARTGSARPGSGRPESAPGGTWPFDPPAAPVAHRVGDRAPGRSLSPSAMVGMLVVGVLLGGLCVGGTVMALGGDDEPVARSTTVSATSTTEAPTSTTPTSKIPTSTSTSTKPTSSATRSGTLPAGAKKCYGPKQGTSVGRGTDVTTCAFARAVRDAYLQAKRKSGGASLQVRSPVTKKNYTMRCSGEAVTRCTGGNDAVVILY